MKSPLSRIISLVVGATLALGAVVAASVPSNAADSIIQDPALTACIISEMYWGFNLEPLNEGVLVQEDLDNLVAASAKRDQEYELSCWGVSTLEGLQKFNDPNLISLSLGEATFSDLTPLAGQTSLTTLKLMYGQITDLTPLAGLTGLTELDLRQNQISDLSPLIGMSNLNMLDISYNQLETLADVARLARLMILDISGNNVTDFASLEALPNLDELTADDTGISDVRPISKLVTLTTLSLDNNQISDISPLSGMPSLRGLSLRGNKIVDVAPLAGLTNLGGLALDHNQITTVSALQSLEYLGDLSLNDNKIVDVSPLAGLTFLRVLHLNNNQIVTVAGLQSLSNLEFLYLNDNKIVDFAPLAGLTHLWGLGLDNNQIVSLPGLQSLLELAYLSLNGNKIVDLSPLAGLNNLYSLELSNNQITEIKGLKSLDHLEFLYLDGNSISDLTGFAAWDGRDLWTLHLQNNQIKDLTGLAGLKWLYQLNLSNNLIANVTPIVGLDIASELDLSNNLLTDIGPLSAFTGIGTLKLFGNKISDISPIADYINNSFTIDPDTGRIDRGHWWSLDNNQITDLSSLDWDKIGPLWNTVTSEYENGVSDFTVRKQTIVSTESPEVGSTQPLPTVTTASDSPYPITWSVTSGNATINSTAGTVTFNSVGPVTLSWSDGFSAPCPEFQMTGPCASGTASSVMVSFFSGKMQFNVVSSSGTPDPEPSVADSSVELNPVNGATTGGKARLANGVDSYNLVVTLRDASGNALNGFAGDLSVSAPAGVTVSSIVANGDGTYSVTAKSSVPGNYELSILLKGDPVGDPVAMNFISAAVGQASVLPGATQSATGSGFLSGEKVTITVNPGSINLGTFTASTAGAVSMSISMPADTETGRYTVTFAGAVSGEVAAGFDVVSSSTPGPTTPAPTTPVPTTPVPTTPAPTTPAPTTPVPTTPVPTTPAPTTPAPTTPAPTTPAPTTPAPTTPGPTTPPTPDTEPSVDDSTVEKGQVQSSTTGGAAPMANGTDSYTLIVTLNDADGNPVSGFAGDLSVDAPAGVTVSSIIDNGDGTYSIKVTSKAPGNYKVSVLLNDDPIGDPIPVNFISAVIVLGALTAGQTQTATGFGFLPGENVTVVVNSNPINLGTFAASAAGTVTVTFVIPKDFAAGLHTVTFTGDASGRAIVAFEVRMAQNGGPAGPKPPAAPTGGVSLPSGGLWWLVLLIMGGAGLVSAGMIRRES